MRAVAIAQREACLEVAAQLLVELLRQRRVHRLLVLYVLRLQLLRAIHGGVETTVVTQNSPQPLRTLLCKQKLHNAIRL